MGKTLDDADAEVGRGIESVEAACGAPHVLKGENLEGVARGVDVELVRQPVGVVAAITPFNFPAMIPLWFLPYAVVCGNTVVLKPSERDPLPAQRIVELCAEVLPPGVVNLVHGGRAAVDALLDHPASTRSRSSARPRPPATSPPGGRRGKRVQALGGAKNAMVLLPDADPDVATAGVLASAFGAAGQRCLAGSVLVLVGTRAEQDAALARVVEGARALVTGPGGDPATDVCPLVDPASRERLEAEVAAAADAGAQVVLDGRRDGGAGGAELGPTILDGVDPESRPAREELFGPVLSVLRADTLEDAVTWMNGGRYGNAAVLFTRSAPAVRTFRRTATAG
jgi:malonate-semialdehyde dehydrogenase (acetylating)/methylmalonate-semialdehyde dehydrogenase